MVFSPPAGDLNGTGTTSATVTLGSAGTATATYACSGAACPASARVTASWLGVSALAVVTISSGAVTADAGTSDAGTSDAGTADAGTPDAGTPDGGTTGDGGVVAGPPVSIFEVAQVAPTLGLKGSGIVENGSTTFQVTDANGVPAPGAAVTFSQQQPQLVTLGTVGGVTDANGKVVVDYHSGTEVGVTSVSATLTSNGSVASSSVAVRGARPSASGFYFRCAKANLPVHTTTAQVETTTCTVRLSDRSGNRVGIPTTVSFATEAGSITATAVTKGFDFANPTNPDEGSVTVTFSTDQGNGNTPADVVPLAANPQQYPVPLSAEPSIPFGSLTRNPRDQFVTIIAMTQGEEAFFDTNHNGVLDANEIFIDQGDPFIDANDNGVFDAVYPGGPSEQRFCGTTTAGACPAYTPPNGKWDALTTIWKPTWVTFTGGAGATTTPPGGVAPAANFTLPCADYTDSAGAGHSPSIFANVYAYDSFLNSPAAGTTFTSQTLGPATTITITAIGFPSPTLDNSGAMGVFGQDFDYAQVSAKTDASGNNLPCVIANGQACIDKLFFYQFSTSLAGVLAADNSATTPVAAASKGASTTGFGCAPTADQYGSRVFDAQVTVRQSNNVSSSAILTGLFAPGK